MNKTPAFRHLQDFIGEHTARKLHKKPQPKPETANSLTRLIVDHIRTNGHFATRLQSTGTYHADAKIYVPSQQQAGMPDVFAIVGGKPFLSRSKRVRIDCLMCKETLLKHCNALEHFFTLLTHSGNFTTGSRLSS